MNSVKLLFILFVRIKKNVLYISDFVDKRDNSLAFAAFGAAIHSSFPLAVVKVSPEGLPIEFLICFHGKFFFLSIFRNNL